MNEMRRLINLVESIERGEILEEGIREKILAAVAAAGIMMGPNAEADTVFVYQSADNTMVTVEEFMDIPDEAQMAYALDTETQAMKMIKTPGGNAAPAAKSSVPNFAPEHKDYILRILKELGQKAIDPGSVVFEGINYWELEDGSIVISGQWNAKNRMGGYTGAVSFVFAPNGLQKNPGNLIGGAGLTALKREGGYWYDGMTGSDSLPYARNYINALVNWHNGNEKPLRGTMMSKKNFVPPKVKVEYWKGANGGKFTYDELQATL